ncbi:MAG: DUF4177 domain-containing protein [Chloroflexota bacterium]
MLTRWEYTTMSYKRHYGRTDYRINGVKEPRLKDKVLADVMNLMGSQGWELVGISNPEENEFTFKRPKVTKKGEQQAQPE